MIPSSRSLGRAHPLHTVAHDVDSVNGVTDPELAEAWAEPARSHAAGLIGRSTPPVDPDGTLVIAT